MEINNECDNDLEGKAFTKLVSKNYLFPLEKIHKQEWLKELQTPINILAEDILRDLYKFVKDFPVEIIPHIREEELEARSRDKLAKTNNTEQNYATKTT